MPVMLIIFSLINWNKANAQESNSVSKEEVKHLSSLLDLTQKSAKMDANCVEKPTPALAAQKAHAVVYSCNYQPSEGDRKTDGAQNRMVQVEMAIDNDNTFMGVVHKLDTGNDVGFTHGVRIGVKSSKNDKEVGFDFATELYTAPIRTDSQIHTGTYVNQLYDSSGKPIGGVSTGESYLSPGQQVRELDPGSFKSKESVRLVDLNRLTAYLKKGDAFYVKGIVGVETRARDKALAASIQDWWHGQVLKIYQFDYVNTQAQAERSKTLEVSNVTPISDKSGATQVLTTGETKDFERYAISEEKLKTKVAPISVLAGGALGTKSQVFQGRCTFEGEAGVLISTENGKIIGPNSNLNFSAKLSGTLAETKKGNPRIQANVGTMMFIYPEKGAVSNTRTGFTQTVEVSSSHGYKNGYARLTPFVRYSIPMGHQVFEEFNDHDPIMRIGVRYTFGGK